MTLSTIARQPSAVAIAGESAAPASFRDDPRRRGLGAFAVHVGDDDQRALRGKAGTDGRTNATGRAGDEDGLAGEAHSSPTCGPQVSDSAKPVLKGSFGSRRNSCRPKM